MKTSLHFFVFLVIAAVHGNRDFEIIDSIKQESECIMQGGMCTVSDDCPSWKLSQEKGLCPKQKSKGIECCYGLSVKETRCAKHGGICLPATEFCNPDLVFTNATDCGASHKCCIMV